MRVGDELGADSWQSPTFNEVADLGWQLGRLRSGLEWRLGAADHDAPSTMAVFDLAGRATRYRLRHVLPPGLPDLEENLAALGGENGASPDVRIGALDWAAAAVDSVFLERHGSFSAAFSLGRLLGRVGTDVPETPDGHAALRARFGLPLLAEIARWADQLGGALPFARRVALLDAVALWCARIDDLAERDERPEPHELREASARWRTLLLEPPSALELLLPSPYAAPPTPVVEPEPAPPLTTGPSVPPHLEPAAVEVPVRAKGPVRRHSWKFRGLELLVIAAVAALATLAVQRYAISVYVITSGSMSPTLRAGDRVLVDRLGATIHRGDVIAFTRVASDHLSPNVPDLVKRVVALPGDVVSSKGNELLVDGRPLPQPWLPRLAGACAEAQLDVPTERVPAGDYFVLGDCRGDSMDSRYFGPVPASHVIGKVFAIVWRSNHPWLTWL